MSSRGRSAIVLILARVALTSLLLATALVAPSSVSAASRPTLGAGGPLPLTFEPNQGQADPVVRFLARGRGYGLFLGPTETVLVLTPPRPAASIAQRPQPGESPAPPPALLRMRLVGADAGATISGVDPLPGRSHYLVGEPSRWRRDVPTFARVRYTDVYPGVSLVFYGSERQLEYDFVVAPGADPSAVVLAFDGADALRIDDGGDLVLATAAGELRLRRPLIYQETDGARKPVDGGYVLEDGRVRFRVAAWDASRPLVIDPVLGYSTYLGGTSNDQGFGITIDADGNAYVTGSTISIDFPVTSPFQAARAGVTDVFVTKLDPSGSTVVYSTYLGGSGDEAGNAIAVDSAGNAYVTGTTNSVNFPVQGPFQATTRGANDAFVAKLDPTGGTLLYSTYLGSNTDDIANGIALDAAGAAYVTGSTGSPLFPNNQAITCLGLKSTGDDAFVVKVNPSGAALDYCRFIGGAGIDVGQGIAADVAGNVWVVGTTTSAGLGVVGAIQSSLAGGIDAFIGKLDPLGAIVYLTYLGGAGSDEAFAVAIDGTGAAYVAGSTTSTSFPTASPLQPILAGRHDAFVAMLNPAGSALVFSTYLGGVGEDIANGIAVNQTDSTIYVVGSTGSVDFPLVQPFQSLSGGRLDAFVAKLSATGGGLVYSTFLGGAGDDSALAVAVDLDGVAFVTGATNSTAFPTQAPIQTLAGLLDAFVTQIADGGIVQFTATGFQAKDKASNAEISVQRTGDISGLVTVDFETSDGTATAGADYTAVRRTLTFLPGQIVTTVTVPIVVAACEGAETVVLTLRNPTGGAVLGARSVVKLTIPDNTKTVSFSDDTFSVAESKGSVVITVNRSGSLEGQISAQFKTEPDMAPGPGTTSATVGDDYTPVDRPLIFAPGVRTQMVSITIRPDTLAESTESVVLKLSDVVGDECSDRDAEHRTAKLLISDEDLAGNLQFSQAVYKIKEPGPGQTASAVVTVTRAGGTASGVTVNYQTADGTGANGALAGTNYTPTSGTLTFGVGQTSATFTVPVLNDPSTPRANPLVVQLSLTMPAGGGVLGSRSSAVLNIEEFEANVAFTAAQYTVAQSATSALITVRRSGGMTGAVTVSFSTTPENTTAVPDVDFRPVAGTLTFPAGASTLTFSVPILNNPSASGARTVGLALAAGTGVASVVEPRTAILTINQSAAAGAIEFAAALFETAENVAGGLATIGVIRSGGTLGGVTVDYATSDQGPCPAPAGALYACAGSDYTTASGTLTFGEGETFKTFTVPITNDALFEGVEALILTLTTPGPVDSGVRLGVRSTALLKIVDDELAVGFSATNYNVPEAGGLVTVKVELTGVSATPVTVQYATSDGTATAGQDYVATSGTLTFPAVGSAIGVRTQTFTIPILPDTLAEGTETINLTLSNPLPAGPGGAQLIAGRLTAVVSITDDDQGGMIEFESATFGAVEGNGTAVIRVKRTAAPGVPLAGGVTVDYATVDGTATAGLDYTAAAGRLTFAAGEAVKTFTVTLLDDALGEGDETVSLTLSNPGGGSALGGVAAATLTIIDDDPFVTFSAPTVSVVESAGALTVTVTRGGVTTNQVTVDFATADQRPGGTGKAVAGVDYTPASGTLTFPAGVRLATFQVPILNNAQPDPDRKFDLLLSNATPAGVTIVPPARAEVTITDDDAGGTIQFNAPAFTVSETGGDAVVTVIRTGGTGGGVSVLIETGMFATTPVAPTATASVDYTALMTGAVSGRRVTFGPGETSKMVRIPILPDALDEGVEQFDVKLSGPCAGLFSAATLVCAASVPGAPTVGPQAIAAVFIVDAQQTVQFSAPEFPAMENAPAATLVVERTGPPRRLLVDFATADLPGVCPAPAGAERACAGVDYLAVSGTLVFESGATTQRINVPLVDNRAVDKDKLFQVQLTNLRSSDGPPPVPATTLGPRTTANVKIKDDDRGGLFSVSGGSVQEGPTGNTTTTVTVSRSGGSGGPVSVFFHARQCGSVLPVTNPPYLLPPFATACDFAAPEGVDFDPIDERLVFQPGELSKTRTIVIHGNDIPEGSRDIRVQLTQPLTGVGPGVQSVLQDGVEIGAQLGSAEQLVRIVEDDLYFVFLSAESYSAPEGAREVLVTVLRSGLPSFIQKSQDIDVVAITDGSGLSVPVASQDYADLGPAPDGPLGARLVARENPFTFAPNETSKTFRVPLLDDTVVDGPKGFFVYIRSAANSGTPTGPGLAAPRSATLTVSDDDAGGTIEFSSAIYSVAENVAGGLATITLARTGGLAGMVTVQAETVDMSGPGTPAEIAVPTVDYTPVVVGVTFNAGEPTATFTVPILDDGVADGVKTVNLKISVPTPTGFSNSPVIGTRSTAMLGIVDAVQTVALMHDAYTVGEGGGTAAITLERTGDLSSVLTVNFATADGTALAGTDYTSTVGVVTFPAGQSLLTVLVPIIDNTTVADDKTVNLTVFGPSAGVVPAGRGSAVLTIEDDEVGGAIAFPTTSFVVQETDAQAIVTIVRTGGTAGCPLPLTVPTPPAGSCPDATIVTLTTGDDTATAPGDYTSVTTTVEFGAGETVATVTVPIVSDGPGEGTETLNLGLSNPLPSGFVGRSPTLGVSSATLSILETELRIGATAYTLGEGGGQAIITVVRVGDLSGTAMLDFVTADGTAVSSMSGDFTSVTTGTLTFAAQEGVKTLAVSVLNDDIAESDESFDVVFSNPVGATIARESCATFMPPAPALVTSCAVTVNILDNEIGGVISFNQPVFDAVEPLTPTADATITVRRTAGGAAGVTVDFATGDDTALAGQDYDATTGTLTFGQGETMKTFTVPVRNGVLGVRSANLFLSNATGGASIGTPETAALRITDRDNSIGFTALGYSVPEAGGPVAVVVRRTGSAGAVLVDVATSDQGVCPAPPGALYACAGSDYTATSTTLTFPAGTAELTVMVPIAGDGSVESNEAFTVTLSNPRLADLTPVAIAPDSCLVATATTCTAAVSIVDDDQGGIVQFSAATYTVSESSVQAMITLVRSGGLAGGVTVDVAAAPGTAPIGDFGPASSTVTFLSGQTTATALLDLTQPNTAADGDRTVVLTLSNPLPSGQAGSPKLGPLTTATLTITDDEPTVGFTADTYSAGEGTGSTMITVRRTGALTATVLVDIDGAPGTAAEPGDFTATPTTLTFGPQVTTQTYLVTIGNDNTLAAAKTVALTLSNPRTATAQSARIVGTNPATLLINDDDRAGTLSFSSGSYDVTESAGTLTVTINRSAGNADGISVSYAVTGGTAIDGVDYTVGGGGSVTFGPNETAKTFTIAVVPNPAVEGPKTITLALSGPTAPATLGVPGQTVVTILDQQQTLKFSTPTYSAREAGSLPVVIERVGPATGTITVDFTTVGGTATSPADFTAVTRTVTFAAGVRTQTVSVPIVSDRLIEGNETFSVQMSNPLPAGVVGFAPGTCVTFLVGPPASCTAMVTLVDDDGGGVIQFSAATYTAAEGTGTALIKLTRTSGIGGPVTVHLTAREPVSSASAGLDYAPVDTIVTFAAGATSANVTIPLVNDTLVELPETLTLQLSSPTGGAALGALDTAVLTITGNDVAGTVQFSQALYTVSETMPTAVIALTRTGGIASGVMVDVVTGDPSTPNGAVAGVDYTPTTATVTFGVGQKTAMVSIPLAGDDGLAEGNKTVLLQLANPRGGARLGLRSAATLKILDDEATVQFSVAAFTVSEGGTAVITVERTGSGPLTVPFTTLNLPGVCPAPAGSGRACASTDYRTTSGSLTFNTGVTSLTFSVPTIANTRQDGNRVLAVTLGSTPPAPPGCGAIVGATPGPQCSATVTIVDNDSAGALSFSAATYAVRETRGFVTLKVNRTGGAGPVTVDFASADLSARAGTDYTAAAGTLTFAVGQTSRTLIIPIANNTRADGSRSFTVTLVGPTGGATLGTVPTALVTIGDEDVAGVIQFSAASFNATECAVLPCEAVLVVRRSGGLASGVSVDFVTVDGTGNALTDYVATSGTVTFGAGQGTQSIRIPLQIEPGAQSRKTFGVILSSPRGGGTLGAQTTATVNVTDTR